MGRKRTRKLLIFKCNNLKCNNIIKTYNKNQKFCCRSCNIIFNNTHRSKELSKEVGIKSGIKNRGKWENRFGKEKSDLIKTKLSKSIKDGYNNGKYKFDRWVKYNKKQIGKTYEDRFGIDKARIMKLQLSKNNSGQNNPMYGKPSPIGSGNGWSGWYKGWYFRSLLELSYMIYIIERFNIKWKSAERRKYRIDYTVDGVNKTHYADFILNDKYLIEIKPKKLCNTYKNSTINHHTNQYCIENNLIYKIIDPVKLNNDKLKELILNNTVKLTDRYRKKFDANYSN